MSTTRILLCLALGLSLPAATRPHFGFDAHIDAPVGPLNADLGGKLGGGASFQVTFDLDQRLSVRPRLDADYMRVSHHRRPGSNFEEEVGFGSVGIGADLLGTLTGERDRGLYWTAGAGALRWFQTYTATDRNGSTSSTTSDTKRNRFSLYAAAGLGWQFNRRVGVEVRNVVSRYDSPQAGGLQAPFADVPSEGRTASVLQTGVTFRW